MSLSIAGVETQLSQPDNGSRDRNVIQHLLSEGYRFVLPRDYFSGDNKGKIVLLLHDMDFTVGGLQTFVNVEEKLGVKSAFYPRPDADWFNRSIGILEGVEMKGFEVGYQYDCLSRSDGNVTHARELFYSQLNYMREFFKIQTTDYHGDSYNFNIFNLDLYDRTLWHSYGLNEVYTLIYKQTNFSYYTDTDNKLVSPPEPLQDLVLVQLHTDWTK